MNISIIGFGYIGAVLGAVLSQGKHSVNAIDSNSKCIDDLNDGICEIPEPALQNLIKKSVDNKKLKGSMDYKDIADSDVILVTVGTPLSDNFDADLSAIKDVFKNLANHIQSGQTIMLKSTVPPGVTRSLADEFFKFRDDIYIGFSPERLAEGNAINELKELPIIVGGINDESTSKCSNFWKNTLGVNVIEMSSCESAELVKLANNQWIDMNIALANELAKLCDSLPYSLDILEIINGANSLKKGDNYVNILTPSIGVGGYCLTKDPWFLSALGDKHDCPIKLPKTGRIVNDSMPDFCVQKIISHYYDNDIDIKNTKIAVLGYSFKTNSGDTRFTPMHKFIDIMSSMVSEISVFDSTTKNEEIIDRKNISVSNSWVECIDDADCIVFGAAHDDIRLIPISELIDEAKQNTLILDGRRYFSKDEIYKFKESGISYLGVGRTFN